MGQTLTLCISRDDDQEGIQGAINGFRPKPLKPVEVSIDLTEGLSVEDVILMLDRISRRIIEHGLGLEGDFNGARSSTAEPDAHNVSDAGSTPAAPTNALLNACLAALPLIDDEIEQRKQSDIAEYWEDLQEVSDLMAAAIQETRAPAAPTDCSYCEVELTDIPENGCGVPGCVRERGNRTTPNPEGE